MEQSRFVCKLCNKKFPSGKSLGGHMRSHVVSKFNSRNKKSFKASEQENFQSLRDNRKKSWRNVDTKMICNHCGKGFHSLKALCGHLASHSVKVKKSTDTSSVSVSEFELYEQEQVAMSLILLSRDYYANAEFSVNKTGLEAASMEDSDSGYFLDETESDNEVTKKKLKFDSRNQSENDDQSQTNYKHDCNSNITTVICSKKKKKSHVCPFCNRIFKNGQALGGHKSSHFIQDTKPDLLDLNLPATDSGDNGSINDHLFSL